MHLSQADIERRTAAILEQSLAAAERDAAAGADWISDYDMETMWFSYEKRSTAIREYIGSTDASLRVKDVDCRREYMRIDYDAIVEQARELAENDWWDDDKLADVIAYTWEGEGFTWVPCKRTDDRAVPYWRCETGAEAL